MTNKEFKAKLNRLSKMEKTTMNIVVACVVVSFIVMLFISFPLGLILFCIGGPIFAVISEKYKNQIKDLLSNNVISVVLNETLGDLVEYKPTEKVAPGPMLLPYVYTEVKGEDYIKADYKGYTVELSHLVLEKFREEDSKKGNTLNSHFKGQWLICDFKKELATEVYICTYPEEFNPLKTDFTMGHEAFDKKFCVKAKNPEAAKKMLTPHLMDFIVDMTNKNGGKVAMSFLRDGKINVAVNNETDLFELANTNADYIFLHQKVTDEIMWFIDIIDEFEIEESLFKKEANA